MRCRNHYEEFVKLLHVIFPLGHTESPYSGRQLKRDIQ